MDNIALNFGRYTAGGLASGLDPKTALIIGGVKTVREFLNNPVTRHANVGEAHNVVA